MLVHAVLDISEEELANIDSRMSPRLSYLTKPDPSSPQNLVNTDVEIVPYTSIDPQSIELVSQSINEGDVILFKFPEGLADDAVYIKDVLQAEFPDHKVIGLTNDIDLFIQNADEAVDMLEKMIAHIKVTAGTQKKIVLQ